MERATILYDDDCGFCRWSLDKILWWDRRGVLTPVALQSPEAATLLSGMDRDTMMGSWHLVTDDGHVWSAGEAVAPLARLLPFGAPVALLARSFPRTTERMYRWVERNRGRLRLSAPTPVCRRSPSRRASSRP